MNQKPIKPNWTKLIDNWFGLVSSVYKNQIGLLFWKTNRTDCMNTPNKHSVFFLHLKTADFHFKVQEAPHLSWWLGFLMRLCFTNRMLQWTPHLLSGLSNSNLQQCFWVIPRLAFSFSPCSSFLCIDYFFLFSVTVVLFLECNVK